MALTLMVDSPQKNGWLIPDDLTDPRVGELEERIWESDIYEALEHAYMSWSQYLITTRNPTADVLSVLAHFFEQKFLFWTMMICTPITMQNAMCALKVTVVWLKKVCSSYYLILSSPQYSSPYLGLYWHQYRASTVCIMFYHFADLS